MGILLSLLPRIALTALLVGCVGSVDVAAGETGGPVYQRGRMGGAGGHYGYGGVGHGGFYGGYYAPQVYGSWYQRPYPYHFDYYRWRYSTPPVAPECPCQQAPGPGEAY